MQTINEAHMAQFALFDNSLFNDHSYLCRLANDRREQLPSSPSQSNFRVYALIIVEVGHNSGIFYLLEGTNSEPAYIGGSICAERSALVKLRFLPDCTVIKKIVIVTDNEFPISPGLLCREFISSLADPQTPLVLASHDNSIIIECTIGSLHPYPYLYNKCRRDEILESGQSFALNMVPVVELDVSLLNRIKYNSVPSSNNNKNGAGITDSITHSQLQLFYNKIHACLSYDQKTAALHPLQFAAGVLFSNGEIEVAWQLKGLEYGCTLDPVCQLIREIQKRKYNRNSSTSSNSDHSSCSSISECSLCQCCKNNCITSKNNSISLIDANNGNGNINTSDNNRLSISNRKRKALWPNNATPFSSQDFIQQQSHSQSQSQSQDLHMIITQDDNNDVDNNDDTIDNGNRNNVLHINKHDDRSSCGSEYDDEYALVTANSSLCLHNSLSAITNKSTTNNNINNNNNNSTAIYPILLLMIDQLGIAHAPFAQARALLSEHGYLDLSVLIHNITMMNTKQSPSASASSVLDINSSAAGTSTVTTSETAIASFSVASTSTTDTSNTTATDPSTNSPYLRHNHHHHQQQHILELVTISELTPSPPHGGKFLTPADFCFNNGSSNY